MAAIDIVSIVRKSQLYFYTVTIFDDIGDMKTFSASKFPPRSYEFIPIVVDFGLNIGRQDNFFTRIFNNEFFVDLS